MANAPISIPYAYLTSKVVAKKRGQLGTIVFYSAKETTTKGEYVYKMTKYFILDPNAFEHLDYREDYDENDIYNLSMSELVEKYGDDFSEYWVEVGSTSTLEALWEEVEELVADYYENRAIVGDLFSFIPMSIETAEHILSSYNYVLKIEN